MIVYNDELYHYGVKGMRWGRRKARPGMSNRVIRRAARNSYSEQAYQSNKGIAGKAYDRFTGAHKIAGRMRYDMEASKANKNRARTYMNEQHRQRRSNEADDRSLYGNRGEKRISKRIDKGMSYKQARRRETAHAVAAGMAFSALVVASPYLIRKGKDIAGNVSNKYNNVSIMDKSGKTIAKYHDTVKVGSQVVDMVLRKR